MRQRTPTTAGDAPVQGGTRIERSESPDPADGRARIPKPPGEAGRPRRGGYSLKEVLKPYPSLYNDVQVRHAVLNSNLHSPSSQALARTLAEKHLQEKQPITEQSKSALRAVRAEV